MVYVSDVAVFFCVFTVIKIFCVAFVILRI